MRRKQQFHAQAGAWIGLALLLTCLGVVRPARADIPWLTVRLASGESAVYPVNELERVGFEGDTLVVVDTGGTARYSAAAITRIEFLWSPANSGLNDPRGAAALVKASHLFQNQPNPFSPETRISFDLAKAGPVGLVIYGVNGRLIRRLLGDTREAGRHTAVWDGRDDAGKKVDSGVYFYQLTAPGLEESRRMILLP